MPTVTHLTRQDLGASFAAAVVAVLLSSRAVSAAQYESDFTIHSETDLHDLHELGDLSTESLEALLELLRSGVDLDRATAEQLYDLPGVTWRDVEVLLAQRSGSGIDERARAEPSGTVQALSRYTAGDPVAPPGLLRARLGLQKDLSLGFAIVSTRQRLGSVSWDPARAAFVARPAEYGVALPKFFLRWHGSRLSVIAGTFRIGFAERLTLDNTRRQNPHGFHADDVVQLGSELARFCRYSNASGAEDVCRDQDQESLYATRDFRWHEGFRGVAASLEDLQLGTRARLGLHAFGSYQSRSIYQYEIFDRSRCVDSGSTDEGCHPPPVFEAGPGDRRLSSVTLPDVVDEAAAGGHVSVTLGGVTRMGVTGYLAAPAWRIGGANVDFRDSAQYPPSGLFGAVGVSGSVKAGRWRVSAEGARSFDRLQSGGGFGIVQRLVRAASDSELELALRYFDANFVNPHARPASAPDGFEGQQARNEAGARLRYSQQSNASWRLVVSADVWAPPENRGSGEVSWLPKLAVSARTDMVLTPAIELMLWGHHARGPLTLNHSGCGCDSEASRAGIRAKLAPFGPILNLSVHYAHALSREAREPSRFRQDASLWFDVAAIPADVLRLHFRTRYLDLDIAEDASLERSWTTGLEANWSPSPVFLANGRYEAYAWLDGRESTRVRRPNPEHRFQLEVETHF